MIEPTDEMVAMYIAATGSPNWKLPPGHRAGLAAVLAVVERDWRLLPRTRAISDPCLCGSDLGPPWDSEPHQKGSRGCRGGS